MKEFSEIFLKTIQGYCDGSDLEMNVGVQRRATPC